MQRHGLEPSIEADPTTLARRVALDLTGLPPDPKQVREFFREHGSEAYEQWVDTLLASPSFGERWARLWLDLARYSDSKGYGSDTLRPYMWRYRDWVIDAFNRNLPYDQFTVEQLAGDLLPTPTLDQRIATCFHRNTLANDEGGADDEEFRIAAIKDRVDTTMQVWMGLTFACAKCHSHKYDPFSQRDYYSMYAFFNQTEDADRADDFPRIPTPTPEQAQQIAEVQQQLAPYRKRRDTPNPTLIDRAEQRRWEEGVRSVDATWIPLVPSNAQAGNGTRLQMSGDGTLEVQGPNSLTNLYTLDFNSLPKDTRALRVEVLPAQGAGSSEATLGRNASGVCFTEIQAEAVPSQVTVPSARFVRIELPGKEKELCLAEVQVFVSGENIALKARATQSSTATNGAADHATDGGVNGNYLFRFGSQTLRTRDPWWELDLGREVPVDRVVVWNRTDSGFADRLAGYRVALLSEERVLRWDRVFGKAPSPSEKIELSGKRSLAWLDASATYGEASKAASRAIDRDTRSGWRIPSEVHQPQEVVFRFLNPVALTPGEKCVVSLNVGGGDGASFARIRLSGSSSLETAIPVPSVVRPILSLPVAQRSSAQEAAMLEFYWTFSAPYAALRAQAQPLEDRLEALDRELTWTPVMSELSPSHRRETHLMLLGNFLTPAAEVLTPAVPASLLPLPEGTPTNRLGLARWLVDPGNPLTARVAVNRWWAALFARGLVEPMDDFGTQGAPPSHPQLLDWMAVDFRESGWNLKRMLRMMVTSATYRQASRATADGFEKDPKNIYLSRYPRRRMEAEILRDQALAVSGLLSAKRMGPSVFPLQPGGLWQAAFDGERNWPTSQGEDRYRRSLYTFWRRSIPYPTLAAFDAPSREVCTVQRIPSNTPLQALVTLNDPVFFEAAVALAGRMMREGGATAEQRIRWGLSRVLIRDGNEDEVKTLQKLYETARQQYTSDASSIAALLSGWTSGLPPGMVSSAEGAAWTVVANVLLNLDGVLNQS